MSRKERFFNHIKGFQLVYAFAVVVFAAGVASTKIATAQDLKDLEARQDAANVKLITIMDDRFKVLAKKEELARVEKQMNKILKKDAMDLEDRQELRKLEVEQDILLKAIHGS